MTRSFAPLSAPPTFAARLKQILNGEAIYAFSKRSGVSDTALRSYLKGSMPGIDKALLIAQAAQVSARWLITGEGPKDLEEEARMDASNPEYVYIPYLDVEVSAGSGRLAQEEAVQSVVGFDPHWLRARLNTNPAHLSLVTVNGDSMSPTLADGDLIFVDHTESDLRDGIAVFQMDGDLLVKRLQKLPGSLINVISDNPRFAPFTLDFNDSSLDFKLIGRYRGRLSFA